MQKPLRWYDSIFINIYYLGLTVRSQAFTPLILPLLVQQFVGDETKGSSYGSIRLYSLMIALLVQAVMGMLSDRSTHRWGKRRPFLLASTVLETIAFIAIGVIAAQMEGQAGYTALFAAVLLSMVFSNIGHGAAQGLIPDLVPENQRGRYSAIKTLFELPLPLIFVSFFVAKMVKSGNYWAAIITVIATLIISTILAMFIRETPQEKAPAPMDWPAIGRLVAMTALFTGVILLAGEAVKRLVPLAAGLPGLSRLLATGVIGAVGMLFAVAVGVILSMRISLGSEAAQRPAFTWWVVNRLAFLVGANNLASFLLYFIQERFPELQGNAAAGPSAFLVMIVGVAILAAALPGGWLTDKFGTKPCIAASGILATLGTAIVIASPAMSMMYVGGVLVGLGVGIFYTANWALGTSLVPREQAGRYLGISNLAGAGAGAIGAYIGGPIGDGAGFVVLMSIYGFLFLFSVLVLGRIKTGNARQEAA
ncbi:MAG TPA: MFS transporter [Anaerolineaceae bacterium]|jgi:MFS family permease|nr:MFS transporter [Anaerolineaceae bacterium]HPS32740.1 MFS transporter [Anaerolineaceae bacterium]